MTPEKKMRILVVEDEPLIAETLTIIFRQNGFDASSVANAEEAIEQIRSLTPDMVLTDIGLPGGDGMALMRDIGREFPACPILVLTGLYSSLSSVWETALSLKQPVSVFTKPCPPSDLLRSVGEMLGCAA